MRFDVLTLFPDMFGPFLEQGVMGRAVERGLLEAGLTNIRDYARGTHRVTDDRPYGGGSGMVMKAGPIARALKDLDPVAGSEQVVLLSPQGRLFDQALAWELSTLDRLVLICGRYEGVDERVREAYVDQEISIGDFVLSGGEVAAMAVMEAVARLVPGVLGCETSNREDSFEDGLLEHPHYTRPPVFEGRKVPEVLLSGDHEKIRDWRRQESLKRTLEKRPDLLNRTRLTDDDEKLRLYIGLVHYPVYNKNGDTIASAVTTLDLHDLARLSATYGLKRFFIITPLEDQQELVERVIRHWTTGHGAGYNRDRKKAFEQIEVVASIEDAADAVRIAEKAPPRLIATDAGKGRAPLLEFQAAGDMLRQDRPCMLLFGTAWGLHRDVLDRADHVLEPVEGLAGYNHLSVRTAAAVILDRLAFGR
ncbi:MAG: tRNA (guanosine(37)-N1)-methyltransferase TrmD [Thermodesulfobacteriota bacterium]